MHHDELMAIIQGRPICNNRRYLEDLKNELSPKIQFYSLQIDKEEIGHSLRMNVNGIYVYSNQSMSINQRGNYRIFSGYQLFHKCCQYIRRIEQQHALLDFRLKSHESIHKEIQAYFKRPLSPFYQTKSCSPIYTSDQRRPIWSQVRCIEPHEVLGDKLEEYQIILNDFEFIFILNVGGLILSIIMIIVEIVHYVNNEHSINPQ